MKDSSITSLENIRRKNGILKAVLVFVTFLFLVSSLLLLLFCVCYLLFEKHHSYQKSKEYQLLQVNPESKTTNNGYIMLPDDNNNFEPYSYNNEFGEYFLVSELGDEEYVCTGTCFCDEGIERKSGLNSGARILKNGLYFLVASVSTSIVASRLAKDYFTEECRDQFAGETCPSESISSEVEECVFVEHKGCHDHSHDDTHQELFSKYQKDLEENSESHKEGKKVSYNCAGKCMDVEGEAEKKDLICEMYGMESVRVDIAVTDFTYSVGILHTAESKFATMDLGGFCLLICPKGLAFDKTMYCASLVDGKNPSVRCEEIYEEKIE